MFKRASVVMLPTKEKANLVIFDGIDRLYYYYNTDNLYTDVEFRPFTHQHLYIISDDEIKEGDWYLSQTYPSSKTNKYLNQKPCQYRKEDVELLKEFKDITFKIIATNDSSIGYTDHRISPVPNFCDYPQPSQSFIEKYVEEHNKGNIITNVLVKYEIDLKTVDYALQQLKLKINPKDNTITIKKVKDSWDRDEITTLIYKAINDTNLSNALKDKTISANKWIEENL